LQNILFGFVTSFYDVIAFGAFQPRFEKNFRKFENIFRVWRQFLRLTYIGRQIVNGHKQTRDGECLTEDLISGYLEGSLTPVVKAACEVHLIGCDRCRESLATLMRLLRADIAPEESVEIDAAVAEWDRRNLAPARQNRSTGVWRRIFYAAGIAAVIVLAVLFVARPFSQPTAEDLVQDLLQKNRPFNAQLASQPYLALITTRSAQDESSYDALAEEMTRRAADAYRLGRFYLVKKDYDRMRLRTFITTWA
jgi:hypothetical protein